MLAALMAIRFAGACKEFGAQKQLLSHSALNQAAVVDDTQLLLNCLLMPCD
jgi:hypothetical protein